MRIGISGNEGIARRVLDCLSDDSFEVICLDRGPRFYIPKISGLYQMIRFFLMLPSVDIVFLCSPQIWSFFAIDVAHMFGKKTIVYWIGTDVLLASTGDLRLPNAGSVDLNLACSQQLIHELREIGVDAQLLYTPTDLSEMPVAMPEAHAVLLNIPDDRAEFYGAEPITRLIKEHPHIHFIMTRSEDQSRYPFPNVDFRGMLDRKGMERAFEDSSICIRFPKHDGMALSIVEAMSKGRCVICNQPVPHTVYANTYDELCNALEALTSTPPKLNLEAHQYAAREFSRSRCTELLQHYLKMIL